MPYQKVFEATMDPIPESLISVAGASKCTSDTLLEKVRSGDSDSWDRLVQLYSPLVYAKLRKRGLSDTDAADVSQEVFLKIHRSLDKFRRDPPELRFRKWLATIVRNAFLDFVKTEDKKVKAAGGTEMNQMLKETPDSIEDESFDRPGDDAQLVRRALKIIKDDFQSNTWKAFWMTSVDERPSREVADELGMTPAGVRKAKERVTVRLLETIKDEF